MAASAISRSVPHVVFVATRRAPDIFDQTNRNGWYDMDVDAESGDAIDIFVTWTDSRGVKKDVQGTCTLK